MLNPLRPSCTIATIRRVGFDVFFLPSPSIYHSNRSPLVFLYFTISLSLFFLRFYISLCTSISLRSFLPFSISLFHYLFVYLFPYFSILSRLYFLLYFSISLSSFLFHCLSIYLFPYFSILPCLRFFPYLTVFPALSLSNINHSDHLSLGLSSVSLPTHLSRFFLLPRSFSLFRRKTSGSFPTILAPLIPAGIMGVLITRLRTERITSCSIARACPLKSL